MSYHYSYSYLLKRNENMSAQKGIHKVSLQLYSLEPKKINGHQLKGRHGMPVQQNTVHH